MKNYWKVIIILLVIAALVWYGFYSNMSVKTSSPETQPVKMKTYQDKGNQYSLQLPEIWTIKKSAATSTTGINTQHPPIQQEITITQFFVPAEMGVTVQVYKGQPTCPLAKPINTTFAGFPATFEEANQQWTVPTTTATLVIGIAYPGTGFKGPVMQTQPTAVPQPVIDADKKLLEKILSTFKFTNLKPFSC